MSKKRETCLFLSSCFVLLFSGVALSDEAKVEKKDNPADKAQIEKMPEQQSGIVFPWIDKEYSMKIIRPNPGIDNKIVRNSFDPTIDYKLRIFDPYKKNEITDFFSPNCKVFIQELQKKGKRYKIPKPGLRR
jgi:hypothetical protein